MIENLDIQQLKMFLALARTGSYTEAAKRMGRTQSAVSHAIRKLENSIGIPLVAQKGADFRLSEEGDRLQKACETAFVALDSAMEDIRRKRGLGLGRLRLGATVEFGCSILMKHMGPFLREHPEIDFEFYMSHELLRPLNQDGVDLIIDCKEHTDPHLARTQLFREAYSVVCSPDYQAQIGIFSVVDLEKAAILSSEREASWWQRFIYSLPAMTRPEIKKVIPINHIRGMIVAAINGIGVALVPTYSVLSSLASGELVALFPRIDILEDRFSIYQKKEKQPLRRHTLLTEYLCSIRPSEFGE